MKGLSTQVRGSVLLVTFTRPEIRNPLSLSVLCELNEVLDGLDGSVKAVIFTGTSDVFASGADLREIAALETEDVREFAERGQSLMSEIAALKQLTIAAINGYCFGGALDLALACDRRIASPNAKFAHPGAGLGIITGWGGTQRLPRLIGTAFANEMFFTASPVDAERALTMGLVDGIYENVLEHALEIEQRCEI
jgi:enoyl-CoA hydratase